MGLTWFGILPSSPLVISSCKTCLLAKQNICCSLNITCILFHVSMSLPGCLANSLLCLTLSSLLSRPNSSRKSSVQRSCMSHLHEEHTFQFWGKHAQSSIFIESSLLSAHPEPQVALPLPDLHLTNHN